MKKSLKEENRAEIGNQLLLLKSELDFAHMSLEGYWDYKIVEDFKIMLEKYKIRSSIQRQVRDFFCFMLDSERSIGGDI